MKSLKDRFIDITQSKTMTTDLLQALNEYNMEVEEENNRKSKEFDEDRYSEEPGSWKTVPGFTSPSGWQS